MNLYDDMTLAGSAYQILLGQTPILVTLVMLLFGPTLVSEQTFRFRDARLRPGEHMPGLQNLAVN